MNPNSAIKWLWDLSLYCSKPYNLILKIKIIIVIAGWLWTQNVKMIIKVFCEQENIVYIQGRKGRKYGRLVEKWTTVLNKRSIFQNKTENILLQRQGNNWNHRTLCYKNRNALLIISRRVNGQNSLITNLMLHPFYLFLPHCSGPMSKHMGSELHSLGLNSDSATDGTSKSTSFLYPSLLSF